MRENPVQKIRATRGAGDTSRPSTFDLDGLIDLVVAPRGGRALPTQRKYILSPERTVWLVGAKGTAKTTAAAAKPLILSILYPGSRHLIARWRWWALEETTLKAFDACLDRLGRADFILHKEEGPPKRYWIASNDPEHPSEVIFNGLDDLDKVNSQEYTSITVDEANELEEMMATNLSTLLRHRRPGCERATGPYFLTFASNPVTRSHWLHRKFCAEDDCEKPAMGVKIEPHPRENEGNLPVGYYEAISRGMPAAMAIRYIEGKCGPDPAAGDAVFKNDFDLALHVADLQPVWGRPGVRGWDFGKRRPAVVWAQAVDGAVNYLRAELGDNEDLRDFAARVILRTQVEFPHISKWTDYCDPHGTAERDTGPDTSISILREKGLTPLYRSIGVEAGLAAVTKQLKSLVTVNGKKRPMAQFDRVGCNVLIEGFTSGYVWGAPTPGGTKANKPKADGYYEHPMDAVRYVAVGLGYGPMVVGDEYRRSLSRRRRYG